MKEPRILMGEVRHWKCPERGCVHLARARAFRVCSAGHMHTHQPSECPAHEVEMAPCAADEFDARTSVH